MLAPENLKVKSSEMARNGFKAVNSDVVNFYKKKRVPKWPTRLTDFK